MNTIKEINTTNYNYLMLYKPIDVYKQSCKAVSINLSDTEIKSEFKNKY